MQAGKRGLRVDQEGLQEGLIPPSYHTVAYRVRNLDFRNHRRVLRGILMDAHTLSCGFPAPNRVSVCLAVTNFVDERLDVFLGAQSDLFGDAPKGFLGMRQGTYGGIGDSSRLFGFGSSAKAVSGARFIVAGRIQFLCRWSMTGISDCFVFCLVHWVPTSFRDDGGTSSSTIQTSFSTWMIRPCTSRQSSLNELFSRIRAV